MAVPTMGEGRRPPYRLRRAFLQTQESDGVVSQGPARIGAVSAGAEVVRAIRTRLSPSASSISVGPVSFKGLPGGG